VRGREHRWRRGRHRSPARVTRCQVGSSTVGVEVVAPFLELRRSERLPLVVNIKSRWFFGLRVPWQPGGYIPSNYGRYLAEPRRERTILPAQGMLIVRFQCRPLVGQLGQGVNPSQETNHGCQYSCKWGVEWDVQVCSHLHTNLHTQFFTPLELPTHRAIVNEYL